MAMAEKHIQIIHDELQKEFPNISMIGLTQEEKEITKKVHAIMWLGAIKQKPGKYKEADDFIRNIIICNAVMIDKGFNRILFLSVRSPSWLSVFDLLLLPSLTQLTKLTLNTHLA